MSLNDRLYIDVRNNKFKYAQISFTGKNSTIKIKKFGTVFLSDEIVKSGNPWNADNLPNMLSCFLKKERITAKRLFMNISDPSVVIRTVEIPYMSVKNLTEYLKMEVAQYMPIDFESNIYDFKILDTFTSDDKKLMNVLIASAPKQLVENCIRVFRCAGLKPEVVDIYPNTLSRIFAKCSKNVAIADLNENYIDFTIIKNSRIFMYSNAEIKSDNWMEDEKSESNDGTEASNTGLTYDTDQLVRYIRTYLNFYSVRHFGGNVDMLYLFGDMELIDRLSGELAETLGITVVPGIPEGFEIKVKDKVIDKGNLEACNKYMSVYVSNIGMVLREVYT